MARDATAASGIFSCIMAANQATIAHTRASLDCAPKKPRIALIT
jgi:hypothetical protein